MGADSLIGMGPAMSAVVGSLNLQGGTSLSWLWEDRPDELVAARPVCRAPKGLSRPVPVSEQLAAAVGPLSPPTPSTSTRWSRQRLRAAPRGPSPKGQEASARGRWSPLRQRLLRPASRLTLAQVCSAVPPAVWRGPDLELSVEVSKQEASELARYRNECRAERAVHDRVRAARWFHWRSRASERLCPLPEALPEEQSDMEDENEDNGSMLQTKTSQVDLEPMSTGKMVRPSVTSNILDVVSVLSAMDTLAEEPPPVVARPRGRRALVVIPIDEPPSLLAAEPFSSGCGPSHQKNGLFTVQEQSADFPVAGSPISPHVALKLRRLMKESMDNGVSRGLKKSLKSDRQKENSLASTRCRRLLEVRRSQFESLPVAERERLRAAFATADFQGRDLLNVRGITTALDELGLQARSREERDILRQLLREARLTGLLNFFDFVFQIVPQVQQRLLELRCPRLYAEFAAFDSSNTGRLGQQQCLEALRRFSTNGFTPLDEESSEIFWTGFNCDFPELFKEFRTNHIGIEFRGFQQISEKMEAAHAEFFSKLERQIVVLTGISHQLQIAHAGELAHLHRTFGLHDHTESHSLNGPQVMSALFDCGVLPIIGDVLDNAVFFFDRYEDSDVFKFSDFLGLTKRFRDEQAARRQGAINKIFGSNLWLTGPPLPADDVPALLTELGLCTDCNCREDDILSMIDSCNKDDLESFETADLVVLTGKVTEWARTLARRSERAVAMEAGFSWEQVFEMRMTFAGLTRTGQVGVEEVKSILRQINPKIEIRDTDIQALLAEVSPAAARALQYIEEHPQDRAANVRFKALEFQPGFKDQTLEEAPQLVIGFEGYMRLMSMLMQV